MAKPSIEEATGGLKQLDDLLQHRARLGICVLLAGADALSFSRLKELLGETDGNLGAHLRKLAEAGYVGVRKEFTDLQGKPVKSTRIGVFRPITWYSLADAGRTALKAHLAGLEAIIKNSAP